MISRAKKYFTMFGMLASSVDSKLHSFFSEIENLLQNISFINRLLLNKQLKPAKLYQQKNHKGNYSCTKI